MPQNDGTGPMGQGPMTGRGLGPCAKGVGFRRGLGRGFGRGFQPVQFAQPVQYSEADTLKGTSEKKILQEELKEIELEKAEIQKRLKVLK